MSCHDAAMLTEQYSSLLRLQIWIC